VRLGCERSRRCDRRLGSYDHDGRRKITGKAALKQTGDKVTGQIGPSGDATIPIEGLLAGDKLTLKTHPQPGRTAAFGSCELTVGDEKMIGTIKGGDVGEGTIEFVRIKP
jgi:hypothetical protein